MVILSWSTSPIGRFCSRTNSFSGGSNSSRKCMKGRAWTKRGTELNFSVNSYAGHFITCLYFIYARNIYVHSHVKITRQWKSALNLWSHNLRVCSFRWIQKRILDLRTDFAFLSANPNPDFWSGESFLKKDSLDLKSKESKSRLTD